MKKGIIISIVILFLGYVTICLWQTVKPDSWKFYKNTIDKFTTEDKDSILKTFDITLTSKAKISKFEKCERDGNVWYILAITDIKNTEDFVKSNDILTKMIDVNNNASPYSSAISSIAHYSVKSNSVIIYIDTYFDGQKLEITDYNKGIENLFEKLWKEKQSK